MSYIVIPFQVWQQLKYFLWKFLFLKKYYLFEMLKFKEITKIGANPRVKSPPFWSMYSIIDKKFLSNNFVEHFMFPPFLQNRHLKFIHKLIHHLFIRSEDIQLIRLRERERERASRKRRSEGEDNLVRNCRRRKKKKKTKKCF